jgi:hypothetical protein
LKILKFLQTLEMFDRQHLDVRTITMAYRCWTAQTRPARGHAKGSMKNRHAGGTSRPDGRRHQPGIRHPHYQQTDLSDPDLTGGGGGGRCELPVLRTGDGRAAATVGVNFIGGFSALVQKGFSQSDLRLIDSIPEALSRTVLCVLRSTLAPRGPEINMDAVARMGRVILETARMTADRGAIGCAKLVVFANAPDDNPFMAGAFTGVGEGECAINIGVSGPGVVKARWIRQAARISENWPKSSKKRPSRSHGSASWSRWKRPADWGFRSESLISLWHRHRGSGIPSPAFWKGWDWRPVASPVPQRRWLCSTTL